MLKSALGPVCKGFSNCAQSGPACEHSRPLELKHTSSLSVCHSATPSHTLHHVGQPTENTKMLAQAASSTPPTPSRSAFATRRSHSALASLSRGHRWLPSIASHRNSPRVNRSHPRTWRSLTRRSEVPQNARTGNSNAAAPAEPFGTLLGQQALFSLKKLHLKPPCTVLKK